MATKSRRKDAFVKRAAFPSLDSLAQHDKQVADASLLNALALIESAAGDDDRNSVKMAVRWALRGIGRHSFAQNAASIEMVKRLSATTLPAAHWVGKDALHELENAALVRRLEEKWR